MSASGRLPTGSAKTSEPHAKATRIPSALHMAWLTARPAPWIATIAAMPFTTCHKHQHQHVFALALVSPWP